MLYDVFIYRYMYIVCILVGATKRVSEPRRAPASELRCWNGRELDCEAMQPDLVELRTRVSRRFLSDFWPRMAMFEPFWAFFPPF